MFMAKILQNKKIEIWGDGSAIRDYLYVDDLLDACDKMISYDGMHRVFNISSGIGRSLKEIIELLEQQLNRVANVEYDTARVHDVSANVLRHTLAEKELHWQPKIDIETGINYMARMWDDEKKGFYHLI